jgi:TatD DNase family protein
LLVDAHVHCHELEEVEKYSLLQKLVLVCVSDDPESSLTTLELSKKYANIEPCIGIHPWVAHEYSGGEARHLVEHVLRNHDIKCLGEVGLDKKFKPETFNKQLEVFNVFLTYAKEYDLVLNLHAAGAWREVLDLLISRDIQRAYFHWYTGPVELLEPLSAAGYYVGANPAWIIQQKHREVLEVASLDFLLTESDAPYTYRGLKMTPELVEKTLEFLAKVKKFEIEEVANVVYKNYLKLFKKGL